MSTAGQTPDDATHLLQQYKDLGFRIVYWKRQGRDPKGWKGPQGSSAKDWNDPSKEYPITNFDPATMNVGVVTGHEIAPGKFLIDIDFDWAPGTVMAGLLLPATRFALGRKGKKLSHAFFTTSERLPFTKYDDVGPNGKGDGERFVEVFSGNSTHQTMVAPSLHTPPDVRIELVLSGAIAHVESLALQQAVMDYAIACLVLKHTPNGLHHEGRLALSGLLLKEGMDSLRVIAIEEAVCRAQVLAGVPDMSEKDIADAALNVRSTQQKLLGQKKYAGARKFAEFIGRPEGDWVVARILKFLGKEEDYVRDSDGSIVKNHQGNVRHALKQMGVEVSHQEFAERLLVTENEVTQPLDDRMLTHMWLRIDRECRFRPSFDFYEKVVKDTAYENGFHPVRDYLRSLHWDGEPRINTWLVMYGGAADTGGRSEASEELTYLQAVSSIPLIAAVRRIFYPGCKYDEMLVLESPQGFNKSSALRALCPNDEWFSDDLPLNVDAKELIERTLGKWIIEASDLTGGRKADRDHLKAMLSRQVDGPARLAYARLAVERPRQFIIIGTTNDAEYLGDATGSRRFWPVKIDRFDVEGIARDRDQLWAEAVVREAEGESIRLREELWGAASEHQERRRQIDAWEEILYEVASELVPTSNNIVRVATSVLWTKIGIDPAKRDRAGAKRISEIMQRLGFERTVVREEGRVQVGYEKASVVEERRAEKRQKYDTPF